MIEDVSFHRGTDGEAGVVFRQLQATLIEGRDSASTASELPKNLSTTHQREIRCRPLRDREERRNRSIHSVSISIPETRQAQTNSTP